MTDSRFTGEYEKTGHAPITAADKERLKAFREASEKQQGEKVQTATPSLFSRLLRRVGIVSYGTERSGNYGHAGRPGEVGGSAPRGFADLHPERSHNDAQIKAVRERFARKERGGHIAIESPEELEVILKDSKYSLVSAGANTKDTPAGRADAGKSKEFFKERHASLKDDLEKGGYQFTEVLGKYGAVEDSFLVMAHDANRKDMIALGEKYNQDSIIYAENGRQEMIYTTPSYFERELPYGVVQRVPAPKGSAHVGERFQNIPSLQSDFYTQVKLGKGTVARFSLEFDFSAIKMARGLRQIISNAIDYYGLGMTRRAELTQRFDPGKYDWITIDGRHIPIPKGATGGEKSKAIKEHFAKLNRKKDPKKVALGKEHYAKQTPERRAAATANEFRAAGQKEGLGHGAVRQHENSPFDVILGKNGFEVKTIMEDALNDKITIHGTDPSDVYGSLGRKLEYAEKQRIQVNVIVYNEKTKYPTGKYAEEAGLPKELWGKPRPKSVWYANKLGNFRTHGGARSVLREITTDEIDALGAAGAEGRLTDKIIKSILGER